MIATHPNNFLYITLPTYLTASIPFLLITGPLLPDLAVSLCAIIFLINAYKNSLIKYFKNFFFYIFILFYILLILSSLNSNEVLISLKTSVFYIRFCIFSLSTWYLFDQNNKLILYLFYCFLFSLTLLIFDGYYQFFNDENILGWHIISGRISSFFGEKLVLGSYLSRLLPIFFACTIFLVNKKLISSNFFLLFGLFYILSDVLVFLSGERSAFFFINLSVLFLLIFLNDYKKFRLLTFLVSVVLIFIISSYNPQFKKRMFDDTIKYSYHLTSDEVYKINIFTSEHEAIYRSAYKMFLRNTYLGVGPNLFRSECKKEAFFVNNFSCTTHPHNSYIQLLAETGIFGFLTLIIIFFQIVYLSSKHLFLKLIKKSIIFNNFQVSLLSSVLISVWPLVPTGNFFNNWINIIYFLPVGLIIASLQKKNIKIIK